MYHIGKLTNLERTYKELGYSPNFQLKHGFLYWKLHKPAFINQLESLTTELLDEFNEVEFARYILECAQKLTKFVIICSPQNLAEVKRKLEKFKMISKAAIFFKEDRKSEQRQLFDTIP
ncbi:unnamed protein product [Prunus armeniaca]|uniref:FBD domain-containing protein n=1 Tax=Prunus armeniaca TaxID=36596 RepID=A0A6J5V7X8_PRUAR|nr:unnamed protein product [Prunus armeniaca]